MAFCFGAAARRSAARTESQFRELRMHFRLILFCIAAAAIVFYAGCSRDVVRQEIPAHADGDYDTEFHFLNASAVLEKGGESVVRIITSSFYYTYSFEKSDEVKLRSLDFDRLDEIAGNSYYSDRSTSGTAVILWSDVNTGVLITGAHVVNHPDTIVSFYSTEFGRKSSSIANISIRMRHSILLSGFPTDAETELVTVDEERDLAIVGVRFNLDSRIPPPAFNFPYGSASGLGRGAIVYVYGYPRQHKMLTRGIVGSPDIDSGSNFVIDVILNRGYSGGPVLAVRDGLPHLELVGMVTNMPADYYDVLAPERTKDNLIIDSVTPYQGRTYTSRIEDIQYGFVKAISMEEIKDFILERESEIKLFSFRIDSFWPSLRGEAPDSTAAP